MKQKEFLIISLTIFLTIIAWIAADLYHITKTKQFVVKSGDSIDLQGVDIDIEVLHLLEEKK